jgi:hypothetical protein
MNEKTMKLFYVIAALYDGVLGVAFLLFPVAIYAMYAVEPPNHMAYVQFPALLLIVFAAMFFQISKDPAKNRGLILYGCALKVSYCSMVFGYMATSGVPAMYVPFAYADLVFLALFIMTYRSLGEPAQAG